MSPCKIALMWASVCCLVVVTSSAKSSAPQTVTSYVEKAIESRTGKFSETLARDDPGKDLEIAEVFRWKLGISEGTAAHSFRSLGQIFLLSDQHLYLVKLNASSSPVLQAVVNINPASKVLFIESIEWNKMLFLLISFEDGMLQLFRVRDNMAHSQHKLSCCKDPPTCVPKAAEFLIHAGQLYLVLISDSPGASPLIIYQGNTADWDRRDDLIGQLDPDQLTSPTALATFPTRSGTAIVVARNNKLTSRGDLTIYLMARKRLKLVQVLDAVGALAILPFHYENRQQLLVLTSEPPSFLYTWDGKQLISKVPLADISKKGLGSVSYVRDVTFVLLSEKKLVHLYWADGDALIAARAVELSGVVQSATIHENKDGVFLVAITTGNGGLTLQVINLQINEVARSDMYVTTPDVLSNCINYLKSALGAKYKTADRLTHERPKLLLKHETRHIPGKIVVNAPHKVVLGQGAQASIMINPQDYNLTATPRQLKATVSAMLTEAEAVRASLPGLARKAAPMTWAPPDQRPLKLASLKAKNVFVDYAIVNELNDRLFASENILKYSKDQRFTAKVSAADVKIETAVVNTLSGMKVEDLLLDSGIQQIVALTEAPSVTAGSVKVTSGKINDIPLTQVVKNNIPNGTIIRGHKTAPSLQVHYLDVLNYNTVDLSSWWNDIRPDFGHEAQRQTRIQSDLLVKNLTVANVNGIDFNKLVASLFVRGVSTKIEGTVAFAKKPTISKLSTEKVLGKPSWNLMTSSSDQVFEGVVSVGALGAPHITTTYVNKLNLTTEVARLDSPYIFTGYAAFGDVTVDELNLPLNTYLNDQLLPPHFLQPQRQIYKMPVRIRGALHVVDVDLKGKFDIQGQSLLINSLPSMFWTKKTAQAIPYPVSAKHPLQVKSLSADYVNAAPPRNLLHCDSLESLPVPWAIPSAVVVGNVEHLPGSRQPPLNPLSLARSVVLTEGSFTVKGTKVFTGGLEVGHLWAKLLDSKDTQKVLRKGGYVIPGSNTWNKIEIEKDLVIDADLTSAKVNDENLCELISKAAKTNEPATLKSILMQTLHADRMSVGVLNSVPLGRRSRRSATPQLRKLVVEGTVRVPSMGYVETVNTKKLRDILKFVVNKTTGAYIGGKKKLPAQVVIQRSLLTPSVNNVDLNIFLAHLLSRTKPQNVTAKYTVASAEASRVEAYDINGMNVGKLLTVDGIHQISGNLRFLGALRVGDLATGSLIKGCTIQKIVESLSVLQGRRWNALEIDGDLSWEVTRFPTSLAERGLGYLMGSAVTLDGDHTIIGETTFGAPVSVVDILADRDIDDVDLGAVTKDSLMKTSPVEQVIRSSIRFLGDIQASSLTVEGNIDVAAVNDVRIPDLDASVIRKSRNTGPVRGRKVFINGIIASTAVCDGLINKMLSTAIVTYDMPKLPPLVLETKMHIAGNLTFTSCNDLNIAQLLTDRVTLDTPQVISGAITFEDDLVLKDLAVVPNINNVDVSTVVTTDDRRTQRIVGPKVFVQDVAVEGVMDLRYLNSLNFSKSVLEGILTDYTNVITGSVTFAAPLQFNGDLTIDSTVNGVTLDELQRRLKTKTLKYPKGAQDRLSMELRLGNGLLSARRNFEEVLYLDSVENLEVRVSNMSRVVAVPYNGHVRLDVYGSVSEQKCGLPVGCDCPVLMALELDEKDGELVAGTWEKFYQRTFTFQVGNIVVLVVSDSSSRDSICRVSADKRQREITTVSWIKPGDYETKTEERVGFPGYVSDAAVLSYGGFVYVIVALSYDAVKDTSNVESKVLRIDPTRNTIELIRDIPTFGASALSVFTVSSVPYVVIGNSYDSVKRSSEVPLQIFRFKTTTELEVVTTVPTVGVVAVTSLVDGPSAIVVVAQAQTNAPVLVFQYDSLYNTFKVIQQLTTNTALPTGLGSFRVSDGFVGLSTADDMFRLYKYCDIQGLVLVQEYRKTGVAGFAFLDFAKHYLFLTSSQESSLVELVVQGR